MPHKNVELALAALRRGEFVVVADDTGRENEGDLIIAAERVTPEALAFMVRHTSGLICVAMTEERLEALQLPLMVADNHESQRTAFTVSVDYKHGTSTGISASDRSATLRALADPSTSPSDFVRPGHVFPLRANRRGVLRRRGHTEAGVDLTRLAGLQPAGALCEIVGADGSMLRGRELERFASEHGLVFITIDEIAAYRRSRECLVEHLGTARLPTRHGVFTAHAYRSLVDGHEHVALVRGQVSGASNVLVRVHSECLTGDIFASVRCDCGEQLLERFSASPKQSSAWSCTCGVTRGAGSGSPASSTRISSKIVVSTPWRRTSSSACRWTRARTTWALRSSPISA